ncbi:RAB8B, partial [Symbiodinium microadriaticum]
MPTPIGNSSLTTVGNTVYVFGGTDAKGACFNDIRFLDVTQYLDTHDITVGEGASSDYSFKILIIGDAAVGKSALLTRFSENVFLHSYTSTIGIDFNSRMIRVGGSICKLEIWDTAGQERFSTITANYYRGAQGALLVYDIGRRESFEHVQAWYDRAKQLGGQDIEPVLIGNKIDLDPSVRQVSSEEGENLAMDLGIPFMETSALNGDNVE